jgi:uroporphyrinogen-III decarboxylase
MNPVMDAFIECGVNVFYPCEPAAGMDIVALRKKYGKKFAMIGGIDKHVLRASKEEIRKELEYKLQPIMRGGGVCFALDHRIPNGTPLENYRYYVKTTREILGIEDEEKGWGRFIP